MAFDVFISYASQDKLVANAACARLEALGIRCWIAPRDIMAGVGYGEAIMDAIGHCQIMLLIFSASANQSPMISREIERAVSKGRAVLPMRIEDVLPSGSLEFFIGSVHWLDALTEPLDQHFVRLAETIKLLLSAGSPRQSAHAEIPPAMSLPQAATPPAEEQAAMTLVPREPERPAPGAPGVEVPAPAAPAARPSFGKTGWHILAAVLLGAVALYGMSFLRPKDAGPIAAAPTAPVEQPVSAAEAYKKGEAAYLEKNYDDALHWFLQGANQGNVPSMRKLGNLYSRGLGAKKDIGQVMRWDRAAADAGDAGGQFLVGSLYENGLGVPRDYATAMTWYRKAALQGEPNAQKSLGDLYFSGLGAGQDFVQAREWYQKAADQGNADAQHQIGGIYQNGLGVGRDYAKAIEWYRKAADQGLAGSQWQIGFLYENGVGVPKNHALALEWIRKAAANGFKNATDWLASHPQ